MAPTRLGPDCRFHPAHPAATAPCESFAYEQRDDEAGIDAHPSSPHLVEHARDGRFTIAKGRGPGSSHHIETVRS